MDNEAPAIAMVFVDRKPAMSCLLMNCITVIILYSDFLQKLNTNWNNQNLAFVFILQKTIKSSFLILKTVKE